MSEETLYEGPVSEESAEKDSIEALKAQAESDSMAAVKLGYRYMNGDGVAQDPEEALKWLHQSESSLGYYAAATIYEKQEKHAEAEKALLAGLKTEDTTADGFINLLLGKLYLLGNTASGASDYEQAIKYLETGLDLEPAQGSDYAGLLGLAYEGDRQFFDAIHWYRAAIDEFGQEMYREKLYGLYKTGIVGLEKKREAEENSNE